MRKSVSPARSRFFVQVAAISLLAGLTAACSGDSTRFGIPAFTGSTANQKAIIGGDDQPMPAPVADVSSQPVQSTQMAGSSRQDALLPGVAPAPVATAAQPQPLNRPIEPVQTAAATPAATGKPGWNAASGTVVTLGPGETLSSVSRRYGVPVKELARVNNIADPSAVGIGTRITIPTYGVAGGAAKPAVAVADENKVATTDPSTSLSGLHTVTPGQTVDQIARLYNVSPKEIAALNHLGANDALRSGQQIKIPGHSPTSTVAMRPEAVRKPETPKGEEGDAAKPVAQAAPGADAPETTASISPAPADKAAVADAAKEMAAAAAKPQPTAYAPASGNTETAAVADAPSANGTSFRWPVRGRIIGSFGSGPTGERNDGINLAVPEGTSIKAVEAGTVIYAGNELQGYGQLVLIRHADGWVSAYAHNSAILVQRGDTVRRGQIISRAGTSGNVSAPQLHFELRKGSKPVNPLDYLQG